VRGLELGRAGAAINLNCAIVAICGEVATLLASLSVPTFTGQRSVPHPNAAEADASSMMAPKTVRHILSSP
jgi:hypothetical protein